MKTTILAAAVSLFALVATAPASVAADMTVPMSDLLSVYNDDPLSPITIQGKPRDAFLVELEGSVVTVPDANVMAFGTNNGKFIVAVGMFSMPALACVQTSKEARLSAIETVIDTGVYKVVGNVDGYRSRATKTSVGDYGTLFLSDCQFERLH